MSFSAFTSSMNSPKDLEAIFTARDHEAKVAVEAVRDTVTTGSAHNILMTGPRGIGKTHLVSLTYYRVRDDKKLASKLRIAWLSEDPYRAGASYGGLLNEILDRLAKEHGLKGWPARRREIQNLAAGRRKRDINMREIEAALEREIETILDGRPLLILSENFDDILKGLGNAGQQRLRAFLQTRITAVLICTATSLTREFSDRESTFYGFFRQVELQPFSFQQCLTVLTKMAEKRGNKDIADMLGTAQGRARVRAIHHLAGGNPRVYVIFYEFLAQNSLDELRKPFMDLVDHLLPYYQGRMQTLSPAQRQYVDIIRTNYGPLAVKDIAREALTSHQSVSSDLGELAEMGYLISSKAGREVFYELREPLMRICLEAKEERGQSVPLFIEFLRIWFTSEELRHQASPLLIDYELYADQISKAEEHRSRLTARWQEQANEARDAGDLEVALVRQLAIYKEHSSHHNWYNLRSLLEELGETEEMARLLHDRAVELVDDGLAWNDLGVAYHDQGEYERARDAGAEAFRLLPQDGIVVANYLVSIEHCGQLEDAANFARSLESGYAFGDNYGDHFLKARLNRVLERPEQAIECYAAAIRNNSFSDISWADIAYLLRAEKADRSALDWTDFCCRQMAGNEAIAKRRIQALYDVGAIDEAAELFEERFEHSTEDWVPANRFSILVAREQFAEAEAYAEKHPDQIFRDEFQYAFRPRGILNLVLGDEQGAASNLDKWVSLELKANELETVALGPLSMRYFPDRKTCETFVGLVLDAFKSNDALPYLGVALVRGFLHADTNDFPDERIPDWIDMWQNHAVHEEALQFPLRLMTVAAEVRRTKSRDPLLGLTIDQRSLLEPHVARFLRFHGIEHHPLDAVVEQTISELRTALEEKRKEAQIAPPTASLFSFGDPVPGPEPERIDALLAPYHGRKSPDRPLAPLLAVPAKALAKDAARAFVERIWQADGRIAQILVNPEIAIVRIDRRQTVVGDLYQLQLDTPEGPGALDLLEPGSKTARKGKDPDETVYLLDGSNIPIASAFEAGQLKLKKKDTHDYIAFYCAMLRADDGRFPPVDPTDPAVRRALKAADQDPDNLALKPHTKNGLRLFPLLITFADRLFLAELSMSDERPWQVDMQEDEPVADKLGWPQERYDGPLRLWAQKKTARKRKKKSKAAK